MNTSSDAHENQAAHAPVGAGPRTATVSRLSGKERTPFTALPDGWSVVGRCRFGTGVPGPTATGCYALAHPEVGVALIDVVPNATPNAEARLRRALTAAEFWPDFPGTLPVMHDRVDGTALRSLPWVLDRGFSALPGLTVPGGMAWIEGMKRAMASDPAWELTGQPKPMADSSAMVPAGEGADTAPATPAPRLLRPRRWKRVAALPVAFAATFAVGVVSGFVLLESSPPQPAVAPAPQPAAVAQAPATTAPATATQAAPPRAAPAASAPPQVAQAAPANGASSRSSAAPPPAASASSQSAPRPTDTAAASGAPAQAIPATSLPAPAPEAAQAMPPPAAVLATPPASPVVEAPGRQPQVQPEQPAPVAAEAPAQLPAPPGQQLAASALAGGGVPGGSPLETRVAHSAAVEPALPLAPPLAPAPPVRQASSSSSRRAPVIDRACSQALFRFQQGERLTAAEQNFIRGGCSTTRR